MEHLYSALIKPFDWALSPMASWNPLVPLVLLALAASFLLLLIFGRLSNQKALKQARSLIKAHLLEVRLFGHDVGLVWQAEKKIFRSNLVYLRHLLKPLLATLPVFAWMILGLEAWFQSRPLEPGESTVVSVYWQAGDAQVFPDPVLTSAGGLRIETPALRIASEQRADWRVRALGPGEHELRGRLGDTEVVGTVRVANDFLAHPVTWWSPAGAGPASSIRGMEIKYPRPVLSIAGFEVDWLTLFLVLSVLFAFLLKGPMRVVI